MKLSLSEWCAQSGDDALLRQWDTARNLDATPDSVAFSSHRKLWWRCERGHAWQASVAGRTEGRGCPYCAGKHVESGSGDLATLFPALAKEWDAERNTAFPPPSEISPWSHRRVWWRCGRGHKWQAAVSNRAAGAGCPYCTNRLVLAGFNDLATTHPLLAAEWDGEKNGALLPTELGAGSHRKVWWRCRKGHSWYAQIAGRASGGYGCPVCAGRRVDAGENDLATAFPRIAAEWDAKKNGSAAPEGMAPASSRRVWWRCPLGHSYQAQISGRTFQGKGCPYCAGQKVLAGFNDLASREPAVAAQWHPELNGALTPETVTRGSRRKVWWICPFGHVWKAAIYSRTGGKKAGCPVCAGNVKRKQQEGRGYHEHTKTAGRMAACAPDAAAGVDRRLGG